MLLAEAKRSLPSATPDAIQAVTAAVDQLAVKRGRGRPKGSTTKLKRLPGEKLQQFRKRKATPDTANRKPPAAEEASRIVENLEDAARDVDNAGKRAGDVCDNAAAECMLPPKIMKRIAGPVAKVCREAWRSKFYTDPHVGEPG